MIIYEPRPKGSRAKPGKRPPLPASYRRWIGILLIVYWTALFVGTHIPGSQLAELPAGSDKWIHFAAYAGLTVLLGMWIGAKRELTSRTFVLIVVVLMIYAAADELLQIPIPGRNGDPNDFSFDMLGVMIGMLLVDWPLKVLVRLSGR